MKNSVLACVVSLLAIGANRSEAHYIFNPGAGSPSFAVPAAICDFSFGLRNQNRLSAPGFGTLCSSNVFPFSLVVVAYADVGEVPNILTKRPAPAAVVDIPSVALHELSQLPRGEISSILGAASLGATEVSVPEPATFGLGALGGFAMLMFAKRRRRSPTAESTARD